MSEEEETNGGGGDFWTIPMRPTAPTPTPPTSAIWVGDPIAGARRVCSRRNRHPRARTRKRATTIATRRKVRTAKRSHRRGPRKRRRAAPLPPTTNRRRRRKSRTAATRMIPSPKRRQRKAAAAASRNQSPNRNRPRSRTAIAASRKARRRRRRRRRSPQRIARARRANPNLRASPNQSPSPRIRTSPRKMTTKRLTETGSRAVLRSTSLQWSPNQPPNWMVLTNQQRRAHLEALNPHWTGPVGSQPLSRRKSRRWILLCPPKPEVRRVQLQPRSSQTSRQLPKRQIHHRQHYRRPVHAPQGHQLQWPRQVPPL
mmetsp:Transcript_21498/g.61641  ORF Transcript_21498/g.61641 Transcript_21498/m.61641 type:complete len:314 (-) Transcript_21498:84-1025(-)